MIGYLLLMFLVSSRHQIRTRNIVNDSLFVVKISCDIRQYSRIKKKRRTIYSFDLELLIFDIEIRYIKGNETFSINDNLHTYYHGQSDVSSYFIVHVNANIIQIKWMKWLCRM